jgi:hypothetical protein
MMTENITAKMMMKIFGTTSQYISDEMLEQAKVD